MRRSTLCLLFTCFLAACARDEVRAEPHPTSVEAGGTAGDERAAPTRNVVPSEVITGVAGGPVDASGRGADCVGWLPDEPQHVLTVGAPTDLSLTATIDGDAVLLVEMSDGSILCDDDTERLDPRVTAYFAPGTYRVFVGTWSRDEEGAPFELTIGPPILPSPRGTTPSTRIPGVPAECDMTVARSGPIHPGTRVVLGAHTPIDGHDPSGAIVHGDRWWNDAMWPFVGMTATVASVALDPIGCPYARVDVDGGSWGWRLRDLGPPGGPSMAAYDPPPRSPDASPAGAFVRVAIPGVPAACGMSDPEYGPIEVGMSVVLGAHTAWSGPDGHGGTTAEATWWNADMAPHIGAEVTVTALAGLDPYGCPTVNVDRDGGIWQWRIRDLQPATHRRP